MITLYLLPQVWIPDTLMDTDMGTVVTDMVDTDTVDMVTMENIEVIKSTLEKYHMKSASIYVMFVCDFGK